MAGGVLGAAATGAALGVAARWSRLSRERHADVVPESEGGTAAELGALPLGTPWSVTADDGIRLSAEVIEPVGDAGPTGRRACGARRPELTVVLVHGFALDRRCWHFQRRALAELADPAVRLVLYDQRSHGDSERASRASCTIAQLGADLHAVLRTLAPEGPLVLVGHSMGGMAIMAMAEHEPALFDDRVAGVALLNTSAGEVGAEGLPATFLSRHNPLTRTVGAIAGWQPRIVERARVLVNDLAWGVTRAYAYGDRRVSSWLVDFVHSMISANAVDALVDFMDTLDSHDRVAALPALAGCESLILTGDADRIIPARHSEVIAAELPDATLVEVPGVGHLAMLERPDVVNDALAELLARAAARRTSVLRRLRKRA
ncbi:MAG: alpha/beta hydrolase [Pseudonocardia sp.]|nr:alpha/beta hydrolase [Pseudonocardia sp.]